MASVVDIFCGAGGLTHGFVRRGFNVVAGIDNDIDCEFPYERNNDTKFILKSVYDLEASEIESLFVPGQPKILVGCAPCQPFSKFTHKREYRDKWDLVIKFAELILEVKPDVFSMENVPALVTYKKGEVFDKFIDMLQPLYPTRIWWDIVNAQDYGAPQNRRRLVVLGSKLGGIELLPRTHEPNKRVSVDDCISQLPPIQAGDVCESDPLHRSQGLTPINLERIRQSKPGGTWRDWKNNCERLATEEPQAAPTPQSMVA